VIDALAGYYESAGYTFIGLDEVRQDVEETLEIISAAEVGTVFERRLDLIYPRVLLRPR
jgi:hypothetical protein